MRTNNFASFEEEVDSIESLIADRTHTPRPVRNVKPHCDCEQVNKLAGVKSNPYRFDTVTRQDSGIPWHMLPTKLNKAGRCAHCNYEPVYLEINPKEDL